MAPTAEPPDVDIIQGRNDRIAIDKRHWKPSLTWLYRVIIYHVARASVMF